MSNKRDNKKNTSRKVANNKTGSMLKLDNDIEIPAMRTSMKDSKCLNINDIDLNKITVPEARMFMKKNNLYKYYIFYEDVCKYTPLNICFSKTLAGYYNECRDEDGKYDGDVSKRVNFVISDDLVDKINDIFNHIEEKLGIALEDPIYKSQFNHYLKTKIYKRTCFKKKGCEGDHIVPNRNKYDCKPLLQIQSIYYSQDDKNIFFIILKYG